MDFLEKKYANLISNQFERWSVKNESPLRINFRCPFCGDSQKSKKKARGWLLEKDNRFGYYCHNCAASYSFHQFLKQTNQILYNDFLVEKFVKPETTSNTHLEYSKTPVAEKIQKHKFFRNIKHISDLPSDHPARQYVNSRQITKLDDVYYVSKFNKWINSLVPDKLDSNLKDEPRLLFPFLDGEGNPFGVSARSFDPKGFRYLTIMLDDEKSKIFGLNRVDFTKTYFVTEGAIDSLFLSNALAKAGADANFSALRNLQKAVFVFDAEPRNREIINQMKRIIKAGHRICVWPKHTKGKDINEMILGGETKIEKLILSRTFSGLEAELKLAEWRIIE